MRQIFHANVIELAELGDVRVDQRLVVALVVGEQFVHFLDALLLESAVVALLSLQVGQVLVQDFLEIQLVSLEFRILFEFGQRPLGLLRRTRREKASDSRRAQDRPFQRPLNNLPRKELLHFLLELQLQLQIP